MTTSTISFSNQPITERPASRRLVSVEARKLIDVRSGLSLTLAAALLTIAVPIASVILADPGKRTIGHVLGNAIQPSSVILPFAVVLLITSEWSQRTALQTFALTPVRSRVLTAKLWVTTAIALGAFALAAIATVAAVTAAPDGSTSIPWGLSAQSLLYVFIALVQGLAFGAVLLRPAPAMVAMFALPIAWAGLGAIPGLDAAADWLDPSSALAPLTEHALTSTEWAHVAVNVVVWVVVPLVAGYVRVARADIR